jgi:hypothetical protein
MEARGQSQDEHRVRDPRERPVVPVGRAKIARFYRRGIAPGLWATNDRLCTEDRVIVIVSASGIMTVLGTVIFLEANSFLIITGGMKPLDHAKAPATREICEGR